MIHLDHQFATTVQDLQLRKQLLRGGQLSDVPSSDSRLCSGWPSDKPAKSLVLQWQGVVEGWGDPNPILLTHAPPRPTPHQPTPRHIVKDTGRAAAHWPRQIGYFPQYPHTVSHTLRLPHSGPTPRTPQQAKDGGLHCRLKMAQWGTS